MSWRWAPWLAACAEVGVVYPFVLLLRVGAGGAPLPAWLWVAVVVAGTAASLWAYGHFSSLSSIRLSLAGAGVAVALLVPLFGRTFDPVLVLAVGLAWWRGVAAAQYGQNPGAASEAIVRLYGVAVAPLGLQLIVRMPGWSDAAAPFYLLMFVAGLGTLAAARAESLRRRRANAARADRHWSASGSLAAVADAALLLLPAILTWALARPHLPSLSRLTGVLGRWTATIFVWMAVAVFFVLQWPFMALAAVLRRLSGAPARGSSGLDSSPLRFPSIQPHQWSGRWVEFVGVMTLVLLLVVIGRFIYRMVYRLYRTDSNDDAVPEERESVFEWRKVWRPYHHSRRRPAGADELCGGAAARVRRLYRMLQAAGEAVGRPRHVSETPAEYRAALEGFLLRDKTVRHITSLYEDVRYGDVVPDAAEVEEAERAANDGLSSRGDVLHHGS